MSPTIVTRPTASIIPALAALAALAAWLGCPPSLAGFAPPVGLILCAVLALTTLPAQNETGPRRPWTLAARGLTAFLTSLVVLALAAESIRLATWSLAALDLDLADSIIDGREIVKIWLLAHGRGIYPDMTGYPFLVTLYTPLYHALSAGLSHMGLDVLAAAHLVGYAAFAALAALLTWRVARRGGPSPAALLPLAVLMSVYLKDYPLKTRPDILAWFLAYAAAVLFETRMEGKSGPRSMIPVALLAAAAVLTKQQTLPVGLALGTYFLVRRGMFRHCLIFAATASAACLIVVLVLRGLTGGTILTHILVYPAMLASDPGVTNWGNALPRIRDFASLYAGLLLVSLAALARSLYDRRIGLFDWIVIVHVPFLLKLISTWGADANYFLGFLTALALQAGVFLARPRSLGPVTPAVALACLLTVLPPAPGSLAPPAIDRAAMAARNAALRDAAKGGQVLVNAEGAAPILASGGGDNLFFFDATESAYFERMGLWRFEDSELARDIERGRFDRIILSWSFYDPKVKRSVEAAYDRADEVGMHEIYVRKAGRVLRLPELSASPAASGGLSATLLDCRGCERAVSFGANLLSVHETADRAVIDLRIDGAAPLGRVVTTVYPKVVTTGPGHELVMEWSPDGRDYQVFGRYAGTGRDADMSLFDPVLRGDFQAPGREAFLRLTLTGSARLWSSPEAPMLIQATGAPPP